MSCDRAVFRFREFARSALDFLLARGFTCVDETDFRVRWESSTVCIEMNHGLRDCEVSLVFGRLNTGERFCFTLFLRLANPELEKQMGPRIGDTPEKVARYAAALALALGSDGNQIIEGDAAVFDRMKSVRWWDFFPEALKPK